MNTSQLETPSLIQSTGKAIGFTVMGAVSAFAIFVIMSKLAENQNTYVEPQTTLITPELGAVKEDSDTAKIERNFRIRQSRLNAPNNRQNRWRTTTTFWMVCV